MYYKIIIGFVIFLIFSELLGRNRSTSYIFLLFLIAVSCLAGLLVGREIIVSDSYDYFILIFTNLYLFGLVAPFKKFKRVRYVKEINNPKFNSFLKVVFRLSLVGLISTILFAMVSLNHFRSISIGVSEFKNGDVSNMYLQSVFPPWLYSALGFTVPFSFVSLALHFYFLSQRNIKKSIRFFVLSLAIPLGSLIELSRGRFLLFLTLYFMLYFYLSGTFEKKVRVYVNRVLLKVSIPILVMFVYISNDRFKDVGNSIHYSSNIHPVLFSVLDYAGQWHSHSYDVLKQYDDSKLMYGSRFGYFSRRIQRGMGIETMEQFDLDMEVFGRYATSFRGLVSNLIYDLGYLGAILFLLIFRRLANRAKPKMESVSLFQIFLFLFLTLFVSFFYQGNILVLSMISFGSLFLYCSYLYLKYQWD